MFHRKTLFVLGAGASNPYGLPVGATLRQLIIEFAKGGSISLAGAEWVQRLEVELKHLYPQGKLIREFASAFNSAPGLSIDAFLERRTKFADVGKAILGGILLAHEESHLLHQPDQRPGRLDNDHWYEWLARHLGFVNGQSSEQNVDFITFNYDRSLERYLFLAARSLWDDEERAAKYVSDLQIDHVYGSLGTLPELMKHDSHAAAGPEYGSAATADQLRTFQTSIELMARDVEENKERQAKLQQKVRGARVIVFLGFGFDLLNMKRLGFPMRPVLNTIGELGQSHVYWQQNGVGVRPTVVASAFGLTPAEQLEVALRRLNAPKAYSDLPPMTHLIDTTSLDTLRQHINTIEAWQSLD